MVPGLDMRSNYPITATYVAKVATTQLKGNSTFTDLDSKKPSKVSCDNREKNYIGETDSGDRCMKKYSELRDMTKVEVHEGDRYA